MENNYPKRKSDEIHDIIALHTSIHNELASIDRFDAQYSFLYKGHILDIIGGYRYNLLKSTMDKILKDHPDLANKTKISVLTPDSLKEQTGAGLDQCTEEEFNEFKKLNASYKKFGFPFILAIKGKTRAEILNNFKKRIYSGPETEFDEAIKQVKQIASFRLNQLNNKNF